MRFAILIFILASSILSPAFAVESRNKVEELFIWKISDELKLSVPEEKNLADFVRGLNKRRQQVNDELQDTLKKMSAGSSAKEREKALNDHRRLLKSYSELSIEEVDRIQKLLGTEKAAQYFVLKNDLTNRLKAMLAIPEKKPTEKLAPPKIIEE